MEKQVDVLHYMVSPRSSPNIPAEPSRGMPAKSPLPGNLALMLSADEVDMDDGAQAENVAPAEPSYMLTDAQRRCTYGSVM